MARDGFGVAFALAAVFALALPAAVPEAAAAGTRVAIEGPALARTTSAAFSGRLQALVAPVGIGGQAVDVVLDDAVVMGLVTDGGGSFAWTMLPLTRGAHRAWVVAAPGTLLEATSNMVTFAAYDLPSIPQNLTATVSASAPYAVTLEWDGSADDGGTRIITYKVFRGPTADRIDDHRANVAPGVGTFSEGLAPSRTYWYGVWAANLIGAGPTAAVPVTTPP